MAIVLSIYWSDHRAEKGILGTLLMDKGAILEKGQMLNCLTQATLRPVMVKMLILKCTSAYLLPLPNTLQCALVPYKGLHGWTSANIATLILPSAPWRPVWSHPSRATQSCLYLTSISFPPLCCIHCFVASTKHAWLLLCFLIVSAFWDSGISLTLFYQERRISNESVFQIKPKNVYFKYELNIKCLASLGFVIWGQ